MPQCPMSCLQALLAKLRFEKAEPILKMHELQKVLGHIARDMLARPNLIRFLVDRPLTTARDKAFWALWILAAVGSS